MSDGIRISAQQSPTDMTTRITATISELVLQQAPMMVMEEIIRGIAARYVEENYAAIAAKIDQQAIANLAVAKAGQNISASIDLNTQAIVADVLDKAKPRRR